MRRLEIYLLLGLLGATAGCANAPEKVNLAQFAPATGTLYPPVSVVVTSNELKNPRNRHHLLNALRAAQVFEAIEINSQYADYVMEVALESEVLGKESAKGAKALISASSVGLVPVPATFRVRGQVTMRYRGEPFETIFLDFEFSTSVSMVTIDSYREGPGGCYGKAIEIVLQELQSRESYRKLQEQISSAPEPSGRPRLEI